MKDWLNWTKELQALAQTGLEYSKDPYDLERFERIREISHAMTASLADSPVEKVRELFIPDTGYATPKVDLRAGVIRDGKILMVKERSDGCWTLPGGWADVCETASQGVIREVREESGYIVGRPRLVAVKDRDCHPYEHKFPFHIYKMFFLCQFEGGEPVVNTEISEIDFVEPEKLPPLSLGRVLREDIEMMFHYRDDTSLLPFVD